MDRRDVGGLRVAPPHGAAAAASLAAGCGWGRTTVLAAAEERELVAVAYRRRVQELEAALARLRAEKEAAERAAAALRDELESEQRAAETAATEAMRMIARLQREKAAAMVEACAFRRVAESRAGRVRELQDRLADACALAASYYREFRRAHGVVDPDDDEEEAECCERQEEEEERAVERVQADVDGHGGDVKGVLLIEEPSPSPSPSPSPAAEEEEFEDKYAVDVTVTKPAAEEERVVAGSVVGELCLYARVQALEADSAAVRREVAALRSERAQAALGPRLLRRDAVVVAPAAEKRQSFSVLAIFKRFFSTI